MFWTSMRLGNLGKDSCMSSPCQQVADQANWQLIAHRPSASLPRTSLHSRLYTHILTLYSFILYTFLHPLHKNNLSINLSTSIYSCLLLLLTSFWTSIMGQAQPNRAPETRKRTGNLCLTISFSPVESKFLRIIQNLPRSNWSQVQQFEGNMWKKHGIPIPKGRWATACM